MNRINEKGLKALEFKKEILKDYPKIVKDSLYIALDQLVEGQVLDLDTYYAIKNDKISYEEFEEYIKSSVIYMKTYDELFYDFEVIREKLNELLNEMNVYNEIRSKSDVENNSLEVVKTYGIDKKFVINYFGVEDEKDIEKLMKRKGFVEKFAVLRLTKIFKDFISNIKYNPELININCSLVYYDELNSMYCIDLIFKIDIEKAENDLMRLDIANIIAKTINECNDYFNSCMS